MEAPWPFKTLVSCHITIQCHNLEEHDIKVMLLISKADMSKRLFNNTVLNAEGI
jgi:hypothetical protein